MVGPFVPFLSSLKRILSTPKRNFLDSSWILKLTYKQKFAFCECAGICSFAGSWISHGVVATSRKPKLNNVRNAHLVGFELNITMTSVTQNWSFISTFFTTPVELLQRGTLWCPLKFSTWIQHSPNNVCQS